MATTKISRILFRRGNLIDLPLLNEGEPGYATDKQRLFIGNPLQTFLVPNPVVLIYTLEARVARSTVKVLVNDTSKTPGTDYTITGVTLTFASGILTAGDTIKVGFNSEIDVEENEEYTRVFQFLATVTDQPTGFLFDSTIFNTSVLDYSIKNASGVMTIGKLRILYDGTNPPVLDNDFLETASTHGITFSVVEVSGDIILRYSNTSSATAKFYYNAKLWNTLG
jgi:hypothetical protein